MEGQPGKSGRGGKGRLAFVCLALALALLVAAACLFTVRVGGRLYSFVIMPSSWAFT